jgi:tyrosine-protein kinase
MADGRRNESSEHGDTASFLAAIRDHRAFVVLALCVAATAAVAYLVLAPKRYQAEADVLVTPISTDDEALKGLGLLADPAGSVFTAARLLERPQVTNRVEGRLGIDIPRGALLAKIKATPLPQSDLVTIQATESSPQKAAVLANTFAGELIAQRTAVFQNRLKATIARLQAQIRAERQSGVKVNPANLGADPAQLLINRLGTLKSFKGENDPTLDINTPATPPDAAKPKSPLTLAVIFVAVALLAAGAGLAFEFLSPRVRRRTTLPGGWTLLASVPSVRRSALQEALARGGELPERFWDAWRLVRSRLVTAVGSHERSTSVLVTSPSRQEGKTEAASCLAVTLAATGIDVVLVDANLRDPQLAKLFDLRDAPGLAEVLEGRVEVHQALMPVKGMPRLRVLPAGPNAREVVDLLEPAAIAELIAGSKREADMVIIDGPALTGSAEAVSLAAAADTVLVSARSAQTRLEKIRELATTLGRLDIQVLGVVLRDRQRARGPHVPTPRLRGGSEPEAKAATLRSEVA